MSADGLFLFFSFAVSVRAVAQPSPPLYALVTGFVDKEGYSLYYFYPLLTSHTSRFEF